MRSSSAVLLMVLGASLCLADPPLLILYPLQLQFPAALAVSTEPLRQQFILRNDTHADMEWSSRVVTSNGGDWLTITPPSGIVGPPPYPLPDGPSAMRTFVSVSPAGLKPGVYTGSITITASRLYEGVIYPAIDSPQTVTVTYTVNEAGSPSIRVSANTAALSGIAGIDSTSSTTLAIGNSGTGTLNWSATVQNATSVPWLSVSPALGMNAGSLVISAKPGSLAAGVYIGTVVLTAPGAPTQMVTVTYTVRAPKPATLEVTTNPFNFTAIAGGSAAAQSRAITNSGELPLNWKAASTTLNGGQWLSVAPSAGANNGTIVVSPNTSGLAPGVYAGRIIISSDSPALQAQLPVNLTVSRAVPSLTGGGFYNAASLVAEGVVAGSIASIFGDRLGPQAGVSADIDARTAKLPTSLSGTRVTIDGVAAPLFFVSAKQINLQIPYEVAGKSSAIAHIEAEGFDPADFTINLTPASVAVFTVDGMRAAALNQDGTLNTAQNPASAGSVVQLFATGQGVLNIAVPTGFPTASQAPFPAPTVPIAVQIGGLPARILFAGLAPGAVGMLQLNVEIPAGVAPSDRTPVQTQTGNGKPNLVYLSTNATTALP